MDTIMPAAKAHSIATTAELQLWCPLMAPANTEMATSTLEATMRRARWTYGSSLSEKQTFSAPVQTITLLASEPVMTPNSRGNVMPSALRSANPGATLSASYRITVCQNVIHQVGLVSRV